MGGVITTSRNHIPQKTLRPHNPIPEAVQSQSSSSSQSQTRSSAIPNIPKGLRLPARSQCNPKHPQGLRLPARSSAFPNMPSSSQSQTLKLNKTGSPKQCNPELSSSRRPAETVQSQTLNLKKTGCPKQFKPKASASKSFIRNPTV